jgi:hypothetical protein
MGIPYSFPAAQLPNGWFLRNAAFWGKVNFDVSAVDMTRKAISTDIEWFVTGSNPPSALHPGLHNNSAITGYSLIQLLTNEFLGVGEASFALATLPNGSIYNINLPGKLTQFQSQLLQRPSLLMCWIGANDALGTMTSGRMREDDYSASWNESTNPSTFSVSSFEPRLLTNPARFAFEYRVAASQLQVMKDAYSTDYLVGTAPQVTDAPTSIPFISESVTVGSLAIPHARIGKTPFGLFIGDHDESQAMANRMITPFQPVPTYSDSPGYPSEDELPLPISEIRRFAYIPLVGNQILASEFGGVLPYRWLRVGSRLDVDRSVFLTRTELSWANQRVKQFNDTVIAQIGPSKTVDVSVLFGELRENLYTAQDASGISRKLYGHLYSSTEPPAVQQTGDSRVDNYQMTIGNVNVTGLAMHKNLGGVFGADLIHPSSVGYALVADSVIRKIRTQMAEGQFFGGFKMRIPRLRNETSSHRVNAIGRTDPFFNNIINKRKMDGAW